MVRPWLYSILGLAGFLVGVYALLVFGLPLITPFVVALVVAELMEPLVSLVTWRNKVPRSLAVTFVLLLFVGLIMTAVTAGVARLVQELTAVAGQVPYLADVAMDLAERFAEQFGAFHDTLPSSIQGILAKNIAQIQDTLTENLPDMASTLGAFSGLPVFMTNLLIALVATFFMSRDRRMIGDFLLSLFPNEWRPKIRKVKVDVWASAMGFAKAQLTLILLTMVLTIIGLAVIGSNYAVLMGVVIGVADVMPILGPGAVLLPWIAYQFIFGSKVFAIKLLVLYAIITGIRQVLEAKVISDRIGLHPLTVLFSIYLGFHFFGALGLVAGPLIAILLKAMIKSGLLPIFQEEK